MAKKHIKDLLIIDNSPKVKNEAIIPLLPKRLLSQKCTFELHDVNVSIANGLRRTMVSETKVKAMNLKEEDVKKDDPFILFDFIINRIRQIPVDQSTDTNSIFELDYKNDQAHPVYVKTKELKRIKGRGDLPFNDNITICMLNPGKEIRLTNIYIDEGYGYEYGGYKDACNITCLSLDQEPYDPYTQKGIRSSVSNPMMHKLSFITNGTIPPKDIIKKACDSMIERLNAILENKFETSQDIHILLVNNESHTIGNMIMKSVTILYPNIEAITYKVNEFDRQLSIKIKTSKENVVSVLKKSVDYNIEIIKKIKSEI